MQDIFVDAVAARGVPRVRVAILDPQSIPTKVEIVTDASVVTQRILVTGLPNQCLKCHGFGHQARSCPHFLTTDVPATPQSAHQAAQDPFRLTTSSPPGEGVRFFLVLNPPYFG